MVLCAFGDALAFLAVSMLFLLVLVVDSDVSGWLLGSSRWLLSGSSGGFR